MGEENEYAADNSNSSKMFDEFPFLKVFPFEDYEFFIGKESQFNSQLGSKEDIEFLSFIHKDREDDLCLFFNKDDIHFLNRKATSVNKLDEFIAKFNKGIFSSNLEEKVNIAKESAAFLGKIDNSLLNDFYHIIKDLVGQASLSIQSIILRKIELIEAGTNPELSAYEKEIIMIYYTFRLHHAKIILGIIIASKIY